MTETRTLSSFDRSYTIERLKHQARNMRLEAARAASLLATQLMSLGCHDRGGSDRARARSDKHAPAFKA